MTLRLGYKASAEQFDPRQLLGYGVLAEELGFDSVFISDHFQPWRHNRGHAPFAFAWLAALGERTERVLMGTSVVTPTFRYHPAVVAQAMATVACLSPGRLALGVGTGEALNEVALGAAWPDSKERFARLKEAVEIIRRLWTEERVTYQGTYYRTDRATIYDRPAERVPIYIAASGPAAARLAGRMADGFICTSGKPVELYRDTLLPAVQEGQVKADREPHSLELMIEMKVSFDSDLQRAREDTRHWAALALTNEEKTGVDDPLEMERLSDALSVDRAATRWIVSADVDEHVEAIQRYVDLGFQHLVFHAPGPDQERFLRSYAAEVLPRLRSPAV
ncbi:MAG: glucose-6-phosphate dehydrogenase (coenzyme-F420) [Candidatus Dormibacteria bacterium]